MNDVSTDKRAFRGRFPAVDRPNSTAEVLQAEGVRLIDDGRPAEAAEVLERARQLVRSAGLGQEYIVPVLPWLATALRQEAETVSSLAPAERKALIRRARRMTRAAVRIAPSFQNTLPHALREAALLAAMEGRRRRSRKLFDRALAVAERQRAEYERAQTLVARARAGVALGWADAAEDASRGRRVLRALEKGLEAGEDQAEFAVVEELSRSLEQRGQERSETLSSANLELTQEIAERKRSEERTRKILDTAHEAFISMDAQGLVTFWNPQAEETFGWSREEVLGRELANLIIPHEYREAHRRGLAHFHRTGEGPVLDQRLELSALRRDGSEFPVELTISPLKTGDSWVFNAFLRDISERKRAEQYLAAQSAVNRVLAESETYEEAAPRYLEALSREMGWVLGQLWSVDRDADRLSRSASWSSPEIEVQGFEAASASMTFARGQGLPGRVWKSHEPAWVQDVTRDLNFPRAAAAGECGLRGAVALPLLGDDGFLGVIEFFSPEIRKPDEKMIEMMVVVGAQIGQFVERKGAEREAQRLKDEFFSLVSHEFRTPLTSILGYVDLLQSEEGGAVSDSEREEFLGVVKRNSERLRRLVDDLLFISKVQAGKFSITPRPLDIGELVHHCVDAARPLAERAEIELAFRAEWIPPFRGDPDRLAQLFDNLISNAVKYTAAGERIEVTISNGAEGMLAHVRNTGAHIPAPDLERLFEPFFRSSTADTREVAGIGLGLAIARSIAEAHGGRIAVESVPEVGTTFTVDLPLGGADRGLEGFESDAVAA